MESVINYEAFRINLAALVASKREQQQVIAAECGMSANTFARYITGNRKPELEYAARLAKYFGVSMEWLMGMENPPYNALVEDQRRMLELFGRATDSDRDVIMMILSKYERTTDRA